MLYYKTGRFLMGNFKYRFFANLAWENNRFLEGRKLADWILAVVWRFAFAYITRLRLYVCGAADFYQSH